MKYFHRTSVSPDQVMAEAASYFGRVLSPVEEGPRRRKFTGLLGVLAVTAEAEGGHYTLVTLETNQPAESEIDRMAKRFLGRVHALTHLSHQLRGAY